MNRALICALNQLNLSLFWQIEKSTLLCCLRDSELRSINRLGCGCYSNQVQNDIVPLNHNFIFVDSLRDEKPKGKLLELLFEHRVKHNAKFTYQVESKDSFEKYIIDYFTQENKFLFFVFSPYSNSALGTIGAVIYKSTCQLTYVLKFENPNQFSFTPIFNAFLEFIGKSRGITYFELLVRHDNVKAMAFYSKCGFTPTGNEYVHSSQIRLSRKYSIS